MDGFEPLLELRHSAEIWRSSPLSHPSFNHYCVMCQAAQNGNLALVKYLHHKGANINDKNKYGQTPILLAALNGYRSVVKFLYQKGAGFQFAKTQKIGDVNPHSRIIKKGPQNNFDLQLQQFEENFKTK